MANIDLLVPKLDQKLQSLYQEKYLATSSEKIGDLERPLLPEYVKMSSTGGITPAIELIILDALAKYFNLYDGYRERQQILVAMAEELKDSTTTAEIVSSIKLLKNAYPSTYLLIQPKLIFIRVSHAHTIARALKKPETRSKVAIGMAVFGAVIFVSMLVNSSKKSPSSSSSTSENSQISASLVQANNQNNSSLPTQTSNPTLTETSSQVPISQSSPVMTEDPQSRLLVATYQSHCTLLSAQNQSENIIDDNCNIAQTVDRKNYTLNWTNGGVSHVEIITDSQAIIDGEQARIVDKNSNGITIAFSKGRIGWDLKQ